MGEDELEHVVSFVDDVRTLAALRHVSSVFAHRLVPMRLIEVRCHRRQTAILAEASKRGEEAVAASIDACIVSGLLGDELAEDEIHLLWRTVSAQWQELCASIDRLSPAPSSVAASPRRGAAAGGVNPRLTALRSHYIHALEQKVVRLAKRVVRLVSGSPAGLALRTHSAQRRVQLLLLQALSVHQLWSHGPPATRADSARLVTSVFAQLDRCIREDLKPCATIAYTVDFAWGVVTYERLQRAGQCAGAETEDGGDDGDVHGHHIHERIVPFSGDGDPRLGGGRWSWQWRGEPSLCQALRWPRLHPDDDEDVDEAD